MNAVATLRAAWTGDRTERAGRLAPFVLASLALVPLARGGFVAGLGTTVAFACLTVAQAARRSATSPRVAASPCTQRLAWLACFALAWSALALIPLPASWRAVLAPGATALDRALGAGEGAAPLSQDAAATRFALLAIALGTAVVAAAREIAANRDARRLLLGAVVVGACAVGAVGIAESLLGAPLIHTDLPPHARPFGPFANRNHAASLLVLALPLALGFARDAARARARGCSFWIGASAILTLALLVNGSRGGSLAAVAVLLFACALARVALAVKVAVAAGVALALVLPGTAWERRGDATTVGERVQLARDALRMAGDSPLMGVGLGSFGAAYPPYQRVEKDLRFRHVESEPIELLVEGGVPLALLALAAFVIVVGVAARCFRQARSATSAALAASAVAIPFHACCDFPLRVPGVVLPGLLVVGSLLAIHDRDFAAATPAGEGAS